MTCGDSIHWFCLTDKSRLAIGVILQLFINLVKKDVIKFVC